MNEAVTTQDSLLAGSPINRKNIIISDINTGIQIATAATGTSQTNNDGKSYTIVAKKPTNAADLNEGTMYLVRTPGINNVAGILTKKGTSECTFAGNSVTNAQNETIKTEHMIASIRIYDYLGYSLLSTAEIGTITNNIGDEIETLETVICGTILPIRIGDSYLITYQQGDSNFEHCTTYMVCEGRKDGGFGSVVTFSLHGLQENDGSADLAQDENSRITTLKKVITDIPWQSSFMYGAGVDAITGDTMGSAIKSFTVEESSSQSEKSLFRFVMNLSDFNQEVEASTKGEYNIQGVAITESTSYLQKIQQNNLSFTLLAEHVILHDYYDVANNIEITEAAKGLLADPDKFKEAYGDYFVVGGLRISTFRVAYVCSAEYSSTLKEFKTSLGVSIPDMFSKEGSSKFSEAASEFGINVEISWTMVGKKGTLPITITSPEQVIEALNWFRENHAGVYQDAKLQHYSTLDANYPITVPCDPNVFVALRALYTHIWDIRATYNSLPQNYQKKYKDEFVFLDDSISANQAYLPTDTELRFDLTKRAKVFLEEIQRVSERREFYSKVKSLIDTEPKQDYEMGGTKQYGYRSYSESQAVVIKKASQSLSEKWNSAGWRQGWLRFGPSGGEKIIVGWEVIDNWGANNSGQWRKKVPQIILRDYGDIWVKSKHLRGLNFTVIYYYVDSADYAFN